MAPTKHRKEVSFNEEDEFFSAKSFSSESQTTTSVTDPKGHHSIQRSESFDEMRVYGLPDDDSASETSYVLDGNQLLMVRAEQWDDFAMSKTDELSHEDSDDSGIDSGELGSDLDTYDERRQTNSESALFGERPWTSITPAQMISKLMDAVNFQLSDFEIPTDNTNTEASVDEDPMHRSSFPKRIFNIPRDVYPEHIMLALRVASEACFPTTDESERKLKHELPRVVAAMSVGFDPRKSKNFETIRLYHPSNTNFEDLEESWVCWHKHITHLQTNLTSIINTRITLIEAGHHLLTWLDKSKLEFASWRPDPIQFRTENGMATYELNTPYDPEHEQHGLPRNLYDIACDREKAVMTQVGWKNTEWITFLKHFAMVMQPLRYAQAQFRNIQLQLESTIAGHILMLDRAMAAHNKLEIEWCQTMLGDVAITTPALPAKEGDSALESDESYKANDLIAAIEFLPTLSFMPTVLLEVSPDDSLGFEHYYHNPPPSLASSSNGSDSDQEGSSVHSSEPGSVHSSPRGRQRHVSPNDSAYTAMTSIEDAAEDSKHETSSSSASFGLYIHPANFQRPTLGDQQRIKSAHDVLTEVMTRHEAGRGQGSQADAESTDDNSDFRCDYEPPAPTSLDALLSMHEEERIAREETHLIRLYEFGRIEFENIPRIHARIMEDISTLTDQRCRLGLVVNHLQTCHLCWGDSTGECGRKCAEVKMKADGLIYGSLEKEDTASEGAQGRLEGTAKEQRVRSGRSL